MLLSTLTANLQNQYALIQQQIDALQEQQRFVQAQLQRVGSVESKMESAASLIAEAIAEVREVCPEELNSYQEVINSLFQSQPIAQIQASADIPEESEPEENRVPPQDDPQDDIETLEAVATHVDAEATLESSHQVSSKTLHKQPTNPLRWLAAKRNIDTTNMKRHEIASALLGQVTHDELQEAIAQVANAG